MQTNFGRIVVLLCVQHIFAQEYVILADPEFNIWDYDQPEEINSVQKTLLSLCESYDVLVKNTKVDCNDLKLSPKLLDETSHVINKRDVEPVEEEGSGAGVLQEVDEKTEVPEISLYENEQESLNRTISEAGAAFQAEDTEIKQENSNVESPLNNETSFANQSVKPKVNLDVAEISNNVAEKDSTNITEVINVVQEPTVASSPSSPNENKEPNPANEATPKSVSNIPELSTAANAPQVPSDVAKDSNASENKEGPVKEENPSTSNSKIVPALPSDLAEVGDKEKEKEILDEQQSANAVLLKEPAGPGVAVVEGSESDKVLLKMASNAKISKESQTNEPNTGESAKNVTKASKDTTVLIVLFVAVLAVGVAFFTHRTLKKRKEKAANSEVVNSIRRSLQNLSGNGKTTNDVEQGTELKPLMKNKDGSIVKDYTDKDRKEDVNEKV